MYDALSYLTVFLSRKILNSTSRERFIKLSLFPLFIFCKVIHRSRNKFAVTYNPERSNLKTRKIGCYFIVIKIKEKRRCQVSRTISPPIADPPQVLVKIPIDWS
jgi:hypothetical protein